MSIIFSFFRGAPDTTPQESRGVGRLSPRPTLSTQLRSQPNTPTTPTTPILSPTISPQQDPFRVGDYLVHPGKPLDGECRQYWRSGDLPRLTYSSALGIKLEDYFAETYQVRASKRVGKDDEPRVCTLKKIPLATAVLKKACEDEIQVLSELAKGRHPTTFPLLGHRIVEQPNKDGHCWDIFYLFSEMEIGNLSRMLADHRRYRTMIAEKDVIRIAIDLVDALAFLHGCKPPLLHRNIRPSSVIQTSSGAFKFSSFLSAGFPLKGSDLLVDPLVAEDLGCYADPRYRSPEMISGETQFGRSPSECTAESDIWCMGILLYIMCHRRHPFEPGGGGNILEASLPKRDCTLYPRVEPFFDLIFVRDPKARPTANWLRAAFREVLQIPLPPENVPPMKFSATTINLLSIPRQSYKRTNLVRQGTSLRNPREVRAPFWSPENQSTMERKGSTSSRNRAPPNKPRKDGSYYPNDNVPSLSPPPPSSHHRSKSESRLPPVNFNSVKRSDNKDGSSNLPSIFIEEAGREPPSGKSFSRLTALPPAEANDGPLHSYSSLSVPPSPIPSKRHSRSHSDGANPSPDDAFAALREAQNSKKNGSAYLSADRPPSTQITRLVGLPLISASFECTHKPDTRIDSDDMQDQSGQSNGALRLETELIDEGTALPPILPDESPDIPEQATQAETSSPTDDIGLYVTIKSWDPICTTGHFGDILEGVHETIGKVALKRPRIGTTENDEESIIRRFEREGAIWRGFDHPRILKFLGTFKRGNHIYFVSQYINNGNILGYIKGHADVNRVRLLCETADAIDYLHKEEIVHGDIKASNILVDDDAHVLLCDFGLTKVPHSRTSTVMKGAGTLRWQSPELWENAPRSLKSDVYAFAMTIAEVITGDLPFADIKSDVSAVIAVQQEDRRPAMIPKESNGISYENAWNVAAAGWKKEPEARISISEAFTRIQADPSLV